ncbi:AAEL000687-PA [Aedes aegypti]|uniref:UDP-glucuronosyltransferase n=1 Tax=Aedes aegypti TaxID=7159 RepID=Q17NF9_AEDAE|nr:AAEL000687-PA [Aedes aegypti]
MRLDSFYLLLWVVIDTALEHASSYRILGLFAHPGLSHFKVFHPIMRGLAEAGHQVTVVSYFPSLDKPHPNYEDFTFQGQELLTNAFSLEGFSRRTFLDNFVEFYELASWGFETCSSALNSPAMDQVLALHRSKPYDLIVTEFFSTDCLLGVSHVMKVPFVGLSSCALMPWHYDRVGLPDYPSYIPSEFSTFSERMSFWERFENWFVIRSVNLLYRIVEWNDNRLLTAKFGKDIPSVREIARNTSLILVNQHYTLSGARPLVPAVVEIGGVHIQNQKPLPTDVQKILDDSPEGVIVISWGSVLRASTLPQEKRDAIVNALRRLPMKVLWKWEDDSPKGLPKNVIVRKWLPQRDVLCHPNVRLFLSHGGLLGVSEAVHCSVPVVVTPIYGDQFLNAAALVNRGMGVTMHYNKITAEYVYQCIQTALHASIREAAIAVSEAYRHRPHTPVELAVWSIENVLKNGARRLEKSHGSELSMVVYNSWDVGLAFGIMMVLSLAAVVAISRKLSNVLFKKPKHASNKSKKL